MVLPIDKLENQHRVTISENDQDWLDGAANLVDEVHIVETLENLVDYKSGVQALNLTDRSVFDELMKLGSRESGEHGTKRKCPTSEPKQKGQTTGGPKSMGRKENATTFQRVEILDWYHMNGKHQSLTARHFNKIYPNLHLKQPIISSWVKDEPKWRATYESENGVAPLAKHVRLTQHPEVTEMLELWIMKACEDGLLLTGEVLCHKWKQFADMCSVPRDEYLTLMKRHGEPASARPEVIKKERQQIHNIIERSGLEARDIFNMDKMGLFYA
ncbi:hypothetical protein EDB84DRAFT_1587355 [Lactarius hengduanensis]|nr:hypothetical protein EDB84DRAFT_1587355 [Lactarius hengduanensis]